MKGTRTTHASKAHWLFWKGSLETAEREFLFAEPVWKTFIREKSHYAVMRIFHLLYFCEGKHVPQQEAKTTLFNVSSNINFSSLNHLNANFIIKHNTMQPVLNPLTCYSQMEQSLLFGPLPQSPAGNIVDWDQDHIVRWVLWETVEKNVLFVKCSTNATAPLILFLTVMCNSVHITVFQIKITNL